MVLVLEGTDIFIIKVWWLAYKKTKRKWVADALGIFWNHLLNLLFGFFDVSSKSFVVDATLETTPVRTLSDTSWQVILCFGLLCTESNSLSARTFWADKVTKEYITRIFISWISFMKQKQNSSYLYRQRDSGEHDDEYIFKCFCLQKNFSVLINYKL